MEWAQFVFVIAALMLGGAFIYGTYKLAEE